MEPTATWKLLVFHHPAYTAGTERNNTRMQWPFQQWGATAVFSGHDHMYERFARQDASGAADSSRGIREFVVGTGGGDLYATASLRPNSEARYSGWGIIRRRCPGPCRKNSFSRGSLRNKSPNGEFSSNSGLSPISISRALPLTEIFTTLGVMAAATLRNEVDSS